MLPNLSSLHLGNSFGTHKSDIDAPGSGTANKAEGGIALPTLQCELWKLIIAYLWDHTTLSIELLWSKELEQVCLRMFSVLENKDATRIETNVPKEFALLILDLSKTEESVSIPNHWVNIEPDSKSKHNCFSFAGGGYDWFAVIEFINRGVDAFGTHLKATLPGSSKNNADLNRADDVISGLSCLFKKSMTPWTRKHKTISLLNVDYYRNPNFDKSEKSKDQIYASLTIQLKSSIERADHLKTYSKQFAHSRSWP